MKISRSKSKQESPLKAKKKFTVPSKLSFSFMIKTFFVTLFDPTIGKLFSLEIN